MAEARADRMADVMVERIGATGRSLAWLFGSPVGMACAAQKVDTQAVAGQQHTLPISYLVPSVKLWTRWNLPVSDVLTAHGVRMEDLADPRMTVSVPTLVSILERGTALADEPAFAWHVGLETPLTVHTLIGFAAMSAPTLRDALQLTISYAPLVTTALTIDLKVGRSTASLTVQEHADFGSVRIVILLGFLMGLWVSANVLLGREVRGSVIHLPLPEPKWYARFRHLEPSIRFDRRSSALVYDASLLDEPLTTGNPAAFALAREQLEKNLEALGPGSRLIPQVKRLAMRSQRGKRSIEEVAAAVALSERTLRRRLANEQTSFRTVVEQERRARAMALLRSSQLPVNDIADQLGYANAANFTRAFRRWTGMSPMAFRHASPPFDTGSGDES